VCADALRRYKAEDIAYASGLEVLPARPHSELDNLAVAEENAFFPSPYSLTQYTSSKTDFDGANYASPYRGGDRKVLIISPTAYGRI
jgi:hypothetical protein